MLFIKLMMLLMETVGYDDDLEEICVCCVPEGAFSNSMMS